MRDLGRKACVSDFSTSCRALPEILSYSAIKIAEEAAIADILSDGRLEFGVGRGIARHYASYGIPPEESRARFDEALDFILAAWSSEFFSFDGKYNQAREL